MLTVNNGLKVANLKDTTDFTIKIGAYEWRVHSKRVSKASRFFEVACQGNFRESFAKEVEIHDDNPWDISRLIQFSYLGEYDETISEQGKQRRLTVLELMSRGDRLSDQDKEAEEARSLLDVHTAMWLIASKYDSKSLRKYVAGKLVRKLELDLKNSGVIDRICKALPQVCDMIIDSLHEMPEVQDRIVELLCAIKFDAFENSDRHTTSVISGHPTRRWHEDETIEAAKELQQKIKEYVERGGSFAVNIAAAMENMVFKTFQSITWPNRQRERLRKKEVTHFAEWQYH